MKNNLVAGFSPSEKYYSVGMMTFPIYGKIIQIFQTTQQSLFVSGQLTADPPYIYICIYIIFPLYTSHAIP